MQQACAEKINFFFPSVCLLICKHHPLSADFNYLSFPQETIKSKQNKTKILFFPPHFFFCSCFGRKLMKERKGMLAIFQKVRSETRGGNGKVVCCQSIIIQNSSPAPITSTTNNCSTSKPVSCGFSQTKYPPQMGSRHWCRSDFLTCPSPRRSWEKVCLCAVGWIGVVSRPTNPDAWQLAYLSICSRAWFIESVCVVDRACQLKRRQGGVSKPPF